MQPVVSQDWLSTVRATLTSEFESQTTKLTELTADTGDPQEAHTQAVLIAATRQSPAKITGVPCSTP
jgi:hypothetical protein